MWELSGHFQLPMHIFPVSAMRSKSFSLFGSSTSVMWACMTLTISITLKPTGKKPVLSKSEISGESYSDKSLPTHDTGLHSLAWAAEWWWVELLAGTVTGLMEGDAAVAEQGRLGSGCFPHQSLPTASSHGLWQLSAFAPQTSHGEPGCYHSDGCEPTALPRAGAFSGW